MVDDADSETSDELGSDSTWTRDVESDGMNVAS